MIARLVFEECYDFYKLIEVLEKMDGQCTFFIENGDIILRIIESNRVMTISVDFKEYALEEVVEKEDKMIGTVNLKLFKGLLKVKKGSKKKLTIIFHDEHLEIIKQGIASTTKKLIYDMSYIEESEFKRIKDFLGKLEHDVIVDLSVKYLLDFLDESQGSSVFTIYPKEKEIQLVFQCYDEESTYSIKEGFNYDKFIDDVRAHMTIEYLKIIKNLFLIGDDLIKLHIKHDLPFKLIHHIVNIGKIEIFIAPRVEENDF